VALAKKMPATMEPIKKRPCDSRWKLKRLKSRPLLPKQKKGRGQSRRRAVKRRKRPTSDARKKKLNECKRRRLRGSARKTLRPIRCAKCSNKRR